MRGTVSPLTRRDLLARAGVAAGAAALPAGAADAADEAAAAFNPRSWESVRRQFPLDRRLAHFGAFVLAAHPAPVRVRLVPGLYSSPAEIDRAVGAVASVARG